MPILSYETIIEYSRFTDGLNDLEKEEVVSLINEIISAEVVSEILERLSSSDKEVFLEYLSEEKPEDEIIGYLRERVSGMDAVISQKVNSVLSEIEKDFLELGTGGSVEV